MVELLRGDVHLRLPLIPLIPVALQLLLQSQHGGVHPLPLLHDLLLRLTSNQKWNSSDLQEFIIDSVNTVEINDRIHFDKELSLKV